MKKKKKKKIVAKKGADKKLEELLVEVGLKIAKRGEGALFVIGDVEFKPLVNQEVPPFNVLKNPKLLESLALMDGAVILDEAGNMKSYGSMVRSQRALKNFGTRHSAGLSASRKGNTVVIVSEEDRKIRILKNGKMIMQIDALQKGVEKSVPDAINFLESVGAGTLGAIGTSILAPTLGISLLPGIIMFGSAYYLAKNLKKWARWYK
ncbi:MAG: DNA integrity scanning protein DisA nucleotide-binding domain protein [Nanoarchaeota archaeon]|nr:DNA integrity scanning protein DisA nucleotide-binding domain protein [Nanoarchaeota archaeon]